MRPVTSAPRLPVPFKSSDGGTARRRPVQRRTVKATAAVGCADASSPAQTTVEAATVARQWWMRQRAELAARTGPPTAAPPGQPGAATPAVDSSPWWVRQSRQLAAQTAAKGGRNAGSRGSSRAGSSGNNVVPAPPAAEQRARTAARLAAPQHWRLRLPSSAAQQQATAAAATTPAAPLVGGAGTAGSSFAWARGRLGPASAELSAALGPLATLCHADRAALARAVACLPPGPLQQGVLQHGCQVAAALLRLGVRPPLLTQLLRRCLRLFSRPPEEHALPLLAQLAAAGLLPAQAAHCLERCPAVAGAASLQPALLALGQLLAADQDASAGGSSTSTTGSGSSSSSSRAAEQHLRLAGGLLREQPAAAQLLCLAPAELRHRASHLRMRSLGLSPAELAAALRRDALLLAVSPGEMCARAEALQDELGGGPAFFAALLAADPTVLAESDAEEVLTPHAAALAQEFGRGQVRRMVAAAPRLLATAPAAWRAALAALSLCWVPNAPALAARSPQLLYADLAAPASVAARLALQHALGLSAAEVYERLPGCAAGGLPAQSLACRLQLLLQKDSSDGGANSSSSGSGSAHVAGAARAGSSMNSAANLPLTAAAAALEETSGLSDAQFACRLGMPPGQLAAAEEELAASPGWRHLLAEAEAEATRLQRLLALG
ncbi:hypothetical protein ABPG75_010902 [Micractinium tetrahymenae]